jgi:hypothetical protein
MVEPGRKFVKGSSKYRYSINGQEKETELNENITTAEYWEYDSRIGRRWNVDPKPTVPESPYLCFKGNPILLSDINGDKAGDPPTRIFHRTTDKLAASIMKGHFDPSKSNHKGFTFFTTTPKGGSIGTAAASGNTVVTATIDLSTAKTIPRSQMTQWFNEGLSSANTQLNTKYTSMGEIPEALRPTYQSMADGYRTTQLDSYMAKDGGSIYKIGGTKSIAVSEGAIASVIKEGLLNEGGAAKAMTSSGLSYKASIKTVGTVFVLLAIYQSANTIANSPTPVREAITETAGWAGALYGASTGAVAWSPGGPWGAAAGTVVGGGIGFFVGKNGADQVIGVMPKLMEAGAQNTKNNREIIPNWNPRPGGGLGN